MIDIDREIRKKLSMRITLIPIVFCALGIILKGLDKRLEELEIRRSIKTIQSTQHC